MQQNLSASLGKYEVLVDAAIADAMRAEVAKRIWAKDASLWKSEKADQMIIRNSLGWLTVAREMREVAGDLTYFANSVRGPSEFLYAMVCGMGGSSLCPEVLRLTFGRTPGYPALLVLDSTDPDVLAEFAGSIDLTRTLFIIASKSGTTTEPLSFQKYWFTEVEKKKSKPGESFVAITDPGTVLEQMAKADGFLQTFLNQPDIGGRYSALSYFGMVPATLMGIDANRFLDGAGEMVAACGPDIPVEDNPAIRLGAIMAECAKAGRDKLTLVSAPEIESVGLWIEQLVAESTGKEGKGIVPVSGEQLGSPSVYGNDRLFVSIALGAPDDKTATMLKQLEAAGHPVVYLALRDLYQLGAHFFQWELATAFAGWRLGINPFDQPNVQESKDATKELLNGFATEGKLREQNLLVKNDGLAIYGDARTLAGLPNDSVVSALRAHLRKAGGGDYIALLNYVEETPQIEACIQDIRNYLRNATKCATTTGYGPRFLHSTGQLHKGGPNTGVFLQNTVDDQVDFPVPGEKYSFSILKQAQALGDFRSLSAHGRRAIRVHLGSDTLKGLKRLRAAIVSALDGV